jgi:hypothetical protein
MSIVPPKRGALIHINPRIKKLGQYIVKIDVLKDISEEWEIEK